MRALIFDAAWGKLSLSQYFHSKALRSTFSQHLVSRRGILSSKIPTSVSKTDSNPKQDVTAQVVASEDTLTYPEGGLEAWGVVLGCFCIMMSVFGIMNTSAVFESYYQQHQLEKKRPSEIGWIFSLYLFVVYFLGLLVGPVFDKYGHRVLVLAGSAFIVASPMILSVCSEFYQIILAFSVLSGIGGCLLNTPGYAAIGHYFDKRRGLATGLATTAGGVGGIVFPFILQATLPRVGFAWSMRILGFVLLALAVLANLLVRTRLPRSNTLTSVWPDFRVFRDPKFALCCAGIFFMEYGVLIPLTYVVSYASSHGHNANKSYFLPALLNAGSVVGRVIPGILADRIGRFNVLVLTVGSCMVTVFALWLPAGDSQGMLIAFTTLLGFASGGNVSLVPVCIGQLCDSRNYGRFLSSAMLVASFGTLTGIPIGGALLGIGDESDGWTALILFSGLSYAISLACYVTARILAVGYGIRIVF